MLAAEKVDGAAYGGKAAVSSSSTNPLLTLPTDHSLLDVQLDGVAVTAAVVPEAPLSMMSATLRRRLKKILTPSTTPAIRVADGGTVDVVGMCTACVGIGGHHTAAPFDVLAHYTRDLILGLDFLLTRSASIDSSSNTFHLDLPLLSDVREVV